MANIDKVLLNFRRNDSVYKRRSNRKDSNLEFKVHEKGIYKLFGISSYKSLFPIARYISDSFLLLLFVCYTMEK